MRGRGEGVGLDDVGAGFGDMEMDVLDRLRAASAISRSLLPRRSFACQSSKRSPRKSLSRELMRLDHRAHGAVEHQDALSRCRRYAARRIRWSPGSFSSHGHAIRSLRFVPARPLSARTPSRWQMREDEIGAVHRVEMEIVDAGSTRSIDLLGGHRRRDQRAGFGIVVQPVETVGEPSRHAGAGAWRRSPRPV